MKSDEVKLSLELKFLYQDRKVSVMYYFVSVRGEIWVLSLVLPRHFLLKFLYQDRKRTQISPLTDIQNNTWPLTFLSWYRNFNEKWRGKTSFRTHIPLLPRHFLLKFMYQDRKVSGHVLFCMSVRGELWVLSLVLPHSMFELTMVIVQTLISTLPLNV
jgi:hypothetical protein